MGSIVVKVGTSTLTHEGGALNLRKIEQLVCVLGDLCNTGRRIVLVTSGAIGVGVNRLRLPGRPADLPTKQAAAAVGQSELMGIYSRFFSDYGYTVAQILLTLDVLREPVSRENARNTFMRLLEMNAVPIVNENDSVSTFEIEHLTSFGENDTLAANVAVLIGAERLVLLSDIDGLYDGDPRSNPDARLIPVVRHIDGRLMELAGGAGTGRGSGGMHTKLGAAAIAGQAGIPMNIINGENPALLYDVLEGGNPGTVFLPEEKRS